MSSSPFSGTAEIMVKDGKIIEDIDYEIIGGYPEISNDVDYYCDVKDTLIDYAVNLKNGIWYCYFQGQIAFSHYPSSCMGGEEWDADAGIIGEPSFHFLNTLEEQEEIDKELDIKLKEKFNGFNDSLKELKVFKEELDSKNGW